MSHLQASAGPYIGIEAHNKLCPGLYRGGLGLFRHLDLLQLCHARGPPGLGSSKVMSLFLARVCLPTKHHSCLPACLIHRRGPLVLTLWYSSPISGLVASFLAGFLIMRVKPHWIMLISMCAFFSGSLLLATAPVEQSYWYNTFFSILIMPFVSCCSSPRTLLMKYGPC